MINFKNNILVIDHHQNQKINSTNSLIDTSCSATAILIFKIIDHMQININKPIATNLLTGIITDTSSFKNSNTNSQSLEIASKLLDFGADLSLINSSIYNDRSIKRIVSRRKFYQIFYLIMILRLALVIAHLKIIEKRIPQKKIRRVWQTIFYITKK